MKKLQEKIIEILEDGKLRYKNFNQFFSFLSKTLTEPVENIAKYVNKMLSEGLLIENSSRQLIPTKDSGYKKGKITGNARGFAFVKPINQFGKISKNEMDLFISPNNLFGALDSDEILYKEEKNKNASVVKILKRGNKFLIGRIDAGINLDNKNKQVETDGNYFVADNDRFSKPVHITKKELKGAKQGDRVEIELIFQPEGVKKGLPVGRVKKILIKDDDIENGIASILCENQISYEFPEKVLAEAEKLETDYEKKKKRRVDLTQELIMTIDGADAKDFDDAVSIQKIKNGYILGVHIADVGEYVKYESELDKEAFIRGTSVYFPDRVYPMLPEKISNFLCSLNPKEEKLSLSVEMMLNDFGIVESYKIFESVIKSSARLTYDQVYDVIKKVSGDKSKSKLHKEFPEIKDKKIIDKLLLMYELSQKIDKIRENEGMLDFEIPETYFDMQDKKILDVKKRERNSAHKLIENFMILCNQVIAKHFCLSEIPFVYRVHQPPSKTKINEAIEVLNGLGMNIKFLNKISPSFIQNILVKLKGTPIEEIGNRLLLRSMEKALYFEECLGHFGLSLKYYCHYTSPIRRYPDLTIHRIIKKALKNSLNGMITEKSIGDRNIKKIFNGDFNLKEFTADSAFRSSDREIKANDAERAVHDLFKAKYMQDKIGQEFEGKISGVNNFGIFIELPNTVEGLIKLENLPADDYKFDEIKLILKGNYHKYTIGDKIKIILANVNLTTRRIEFVLK